MTCSWPVTYSETAEMNIPEISWEELAIYETMAAEYLWNWSGRAYGLCTEVIRPCRASCAPQATTYFGSGPVAPFVRCGYCGLVEVCSCGDVNSIQLPGPINAVTGIILDGQPFTAYRVDNKRYLVRTDGQTWPTCQDLTLATTEAGTWEITYEQGVPVPLGGQVAAGVLAIELAKAAAGDSTCNLPQRLQSITRQGVTVAVLDSFDDIDTGHTGIWLIDSWVASVTKPRRGASVYSPDVKRPHQRRQTWPSTI